MFDRFKKRFDSKGIAVIPFVFSSQECDEIKRQAYEVTDEQIKSSGYPHVPSEQAFNKKSLIFFPALANDYINKIRIDDRLKSIVQYFLGDDVKQINNQIYFREPGDEDSFAWHRDTIFRENDIFNSHLETDYLQTIIAIDDISEENGAVEFIEGSHDWEEFHTPNLRGFERHDLKGIKYTANKGDVMLWSVKIVHGSEPNESTSSRMTYMNGFCRSRACNSYPDYLIDGKIVDNISAEKIP